MLVYFAFVDAVAIATSAIGLLRLPAKSKSHAGASFAFLSAKTARQLCLKITVPPVPVKFMRCITNVVDFS